MSPPSRQPAIQIDVDMSPPPCTPVPTSANTQIIDLEASPPWRPYSSHAGDLPDVHVIDPFLSPPPRARSSQGIRLEVSPPSRHSNLPVTLMQDTDIDLDNSPLRCTPLHLPGAAVLQPRSILGNATQLLLQMMHLPMPSLTKPSGSWPVSLRAQSLAQLVARAWSIQAEQTNVHEILHLLIELHHLKERLQDASNQRNQLQDIQGMFESLSRVFEYY
ncbi:hypothetical protein PAXINDRAFT_18055 [Paxillus involutus ATCC 200175]|uniref:Uncharacterized protein n=1 Tax=Paxillus involutus ATCC 200175 TaxID=664439 RepID=A0A0C9TCU1_PAXIN|nr:hypothetical protein PAXINDRAFT_18055 [Paxillus involutus ATCC 200175]